MSKEGSKAMAERQPHGWWGLILSPSPASPHRQHQACVPAARKKDGDNDNPNPMVARGAPWRSSHPSHRSLLWGGGGGCWKIPPHLWIKGFYSPPDPMLLDQTNLGRLCKKPPTLPRWMDTKFKSMPPPFLMGVRTPGSLLEHCPNSHGGT